MRTGLPCHNLASPGDDHHMLHMLHTSQVRLMTEDKHRLEIQVTSLGADVQRLEAAAADSSRRAEEGRREWELEEREASERLESEMRKKDAEIQVWNPKIQIRLDLNIDASSSPPASFFPPFIVLSASPHLLLP